MSDDACYCVGGPCKEFPCKSIYARPLIQCRTERMEETMSKSQERRFDAQLRGKSLEELLEIKVAALKQENRVLWEVINNLMDLKGGDYIEQLARLSGGTESSDSE